MSNQRDREKRREERIAAESSAAGGDRRTRLLQLSAAGVFLAIIIVVVAIIVAGSGGDDKGGDGSNLVGKEQVEKLLSGIPQTATILGKPNAPVKLYEYGDLQCPVCKDYSEEVLPKIIENQVKDGKVSITFRNFIIIGPQSIPAGEAALAAGAQGKSWSFIETWYRNQGEENSGYATDEFIEAMAKYVGVPDLAKWKEEWQGKKYKKQVEKTTEQAERIGFTGTPSFSIEGPGSNGLELLGTPGSTGSLEEAIKEAG